MSLTHVVKYPERKIYTFGDTDFKYIIISSRVDGSTMRTGKLMCKTPAIVTPETMLDTFQGFSGEAVDFAMKKYGNILSKIRVLGYQFSHELDHVSEYTESARQLASRVAREIPASGNETAVLISPDDLWGISIVKIMFDVLKKSVAGNFEDLAERGYFLSEEEKIKNEIEILFSEAESDKQYIDELATCLREYGVFEQYEDRFFKLVKS